MSTPFLDIRDLTVEFESRGKRTRVVDGVNLELAQGEVLGILGESGSGKTLTTRSILGLVEGYPGVVGGNILIRDGDTTIDLLGELPTVLYKKNGRIHKNNRRWKSIVHKTMSPLWGRLMAAVFQNPRASLDPLFTVGRQVEESIFLARPDWTRDQVEHAAIHWFDRVQMNNPEQVYGSYPHELSGGMCQRAMIAVALAREPKLVIADEPTTGLDSTVRIEIVEIFRSLIEEEGRSMLYISHDVREVLYLAHRVAVMRRGGVVELERADNLMAGRGERAEYTAMLLSAADLNPGLGDRF